MTVSETVSDTVSETVSEVRSTMTSELIRRMAEQWRRVQVGVSDRIFVVHGTGTNPRYPYKPRIPLTIFVNPVGSDAAISECVLSALIQLPFVITLAV